MDICDGFKGYIQVGKDGYIIQPTFIKNNIENQNPHSLERIDGLLAQFKMDEDEYQPRHKRSAAHDGYFLGDIWKSRSEYASRLRQVTQYGNQPPSEVKISVKFGIIFDREGSYDLICCC